MFHKRFWSYLANGDSVIDADRKAHNRKEKAMQLKFDFVEVISGDGNITLKTQDKKR
jgi:hypothetical protein